MVSVVVDPRRRLRRQLATTGRPVSPPSTRQAHGISEADGPLQIESGIPIPLLIVIGVTIFMTFISTRRRFGRDIYAYGGNPVAAELAGINTRWTVMKTFVLMGILCAISAAIASARLNGGTLDLGTGYELYVIAAAVIGGTTFAGGVGSIPGAILGALVMQSLQYGLSFLRLQLAADQHGPRRRPRAGRRHRRMEPAAGAMTMEATPMTQAAVSPPPAIAGTGPRSSSMRNINVAFGGVQSVDPGIALQPCSADHGKDHRKLWV